MAQRMKQILVTGLLTALALAGHATPARADLTAFFGLGTAPVNRQTHGFSIGANSKILGGEFEWGNTSDDPAHGAPTVRTYMFNGLLQTPGRHSQVYVIGGWGRYRETLGFTSQISGAATNVGFGVKVGLLPLIKLRLDYRIFNLRGTGANAPLFKTPKRFYVGIAIGL